MVLMKEFVLSLNKKTKQHWIKYYFYQYKDFGGLNILC